MPESPGVVGYLSEISVMPGEKLDIHLASTTPAQTRVELVRLDAAGGHVAAAEAAVSPQSVERGSCFVVDLPPSWSHAEDGLALWAFVMPTRPEQLGQVIMGGWADDRGGAALAVSDGYAEFWVRGEAGEHRLRAPQGVRPWAWYLLVGVVDGLQIRLYQHPVVNPYNQRLAPYLDWDESGVTTAEVADLGSVTPGPFYLAAATAVDGRRAHHFDGKIDLAGVSHGQVTDPLVQELLRTGTLPRCRTVAAWDPAVGIEPDGVGDTLFDRGPGGHHGLGRNKPTRLVTGRLWAGRDDSFELDAAQYSATSFASDSLTDCGWEPAVSIAVPPGTASGVYAARVVTNGNAEAELPFVVRSEAPQNDLLVVLPTMTYIAEGNDRLDQLKMAVGTPIAARDRSATDDFGGSTGDRHPDGTGVCYASRRRPIREFRSDVRSTSMPGPGTFAIDLDLLRFLHRTGLGFDVITDEDLDRVGVTALAPYRVVLTGSRPVYASGAMLQAYEAYVSGGGRLACLGGGGFYWVTSPDRADRALLEVRRGENGMRAWQIGPGELFHATSGERGGLWRGRGRPPQRLLGAGHAAKGFGPGTAFKRMPDSYHRAVSWIFEGLDREVFGERSRLPGGAAGMEIDRYDRTLGSPPHARILATSFRLSDDYHQAIEETLFTFAGRGGRENEHVRADMVFFTTPNDGAVFTAGSAAWCAALAVDDFSNPVARISANLLRGLLAFKVPGCRFDDEDDLEEARGLDRRPLLASLSLGRNGEPTN